jgi:hypothetical protein
VLEDVKTLVKALLPGAVAVIVYDFIDDPPLYLGVPQATKALPDEDDWESNEVTCIGFELLTRIVIEPALTAPLVRITYSPETDAQTFKVARPLELVLADKEVLALHTV